MISLKMNIMPLLAQINSLLPMLLKFKKLCPLFLSYQGPPLCTRVVLYRFSDDKKDPPPTGNANMPEVKINGQIKGADNKASSTEVGGVSTTKEDVGPEMYTKDQVEIIKLTERLQNERREKKKVEEDKKKAEEDKKKTEEDKKRKDRLNIFFVFTTFGGLLLGYMQWETLRQSLDLSKIINPIFSKKQIENLLKRCGTESLYVPPFYVDSPELNAEVNRLLTIRDKYSDVEKEEDYPIKPLTAQFYIVKGFSGYGKTTAFCKQINRLRAANPKKHIFYFDLKIEKGPEEATLDQENEKLHEMLTLINSIRRMSFDERKNTTLVIDDINALGTYKNSKEDHSLKFYFNKIYNLSSNAVNVICVSSSDKFDYQMYKISEPDKYGMSHDLPVPTAQTRRDILRSWWKNKVSKTCPEIPSYVEAYFMQNYSSPRNMLFVIKQLNQLSLLVNNNQNKWKKNVKKIEENIIKRRAIKIRQCMNPKFISQHKKDCRTVIECLLKDYKLQKTLEKPDIVKLYSAKLNNSSVEYQVFKALSQARITCFNQIIGEIEKWALEEYLQKL